jgi:hypothetical protein
MSLWTDYDNICGACEEGLTPAQLAQGTARSAFLSFVHHWEWLAAAPADLPAEIRKSIVDWVLPTFPKGN